MGDGEMVQGKITIAVYIDTDGRSPFDDWIDSLQDRGIAHRIRSQVGRIRVGNLGHFRSLGGGICEIKIDMGPGYRVYFAFWGENRVMLLCGGSKKTQEADILKAKRYRAYHQGRFYEA